MNLFFCFIVSQATGRYLSLSISMGWEKGQVKPLAIKRIKFMYSVLFQMQWLQWKLMFWYVPQYQLNYFSFNQLIKEWFIKIILALQACWSN